MSNQPHPMTNGNIGDISYTSNGDLMTFDGANWKIVGVDGQCDYSTEFTQLERAVGIVNKKLLWNASSTVCGVYQEYADYILSVGGDISILDADYIVGRINAVTKFVLFTNVLPTQQKDKIQELCEKIMFVLELGSWGE